MLIDGRLLPFGTTLAADVVVVGAGPAGITCAEELASSGLHVVLVEAGGRRHTRADDDALDGDGSGRPFPLVCSRRRGFGGTATHWASDTCVKMRPLDPIDLVTRPGRPVDAWPLSAADLEPYYARAHEMIGLEPGYDPERWFGSSSPTPLAWTGGPQLAMFQIAPHDCMVNRFDTMCASPDIDLVLHATVERLELGDDRSTVERVAITCPGGNRFQVTARTVVLACGGIDNARTLLLSPGRDGRALGNDHDNVGRYFMDHLSIDTGVLVPTGRRDVDVGLFGPHHESGSRYQPMLWLGDDLIERNGLPNAAFWIDKVDRSYLSPGVSAMRSLRAAAQVRPRAWSSSDSLTVLRHSPELTWYAVRRALGRRSRARVLSMRIMLEQTPDRDSRILLSDRLDRMGLRRVHVDWRVSDDDLDAIRAHQDVLAGLLEERRVATITNRFDRHTHVPPIMTNYHHIGTTRMHVDPRMGVVDTDCRVHSTRNLYVAGSSVFPSGGYLNPTLTIIALAFRVADTIKRAHRPIAVHELSR